RFGAAIGGGIALQFADMLGDHSLFVAAQVDSGVGGSYSFNNTAAQAVYFDQAHRWNWGLIGAQIPYVSGGFVNDLVDLGGGRLAGLQQTRVDRQTEQSAAGIAAYPINRAQRV